MGAPFVAGSPVAFVTKPIEPPWTDGSKNLVRDLAAHLERPTVTFATQIVDLGHGRKTQAVARGLPFGAAVLAALSTAPPPIVHFFFAPNERSCAIGRAWLAMLRLRGWRGRTVQTVASRPVVWSPRLFFADHVVVQSAWSRSEFERAGINRAVSVIAPVIPKLSVSDSDILNLRGSLGLKDERLLVYPGDLEFSKGAWTSARVFAGIARAEPDVVLVLACRRKTSRAGQVESDLSAYLQSEGLLARTRFVGEVASLPTLLGASRAVLFPVDDLYGKVDHPLVLLEAAALGVPCVLSDCAPLRELAAVAHVPAGEIGKFAEATKDALRRPRRPEIARGVREFCDAYEAVYRTLPLPL